MTSSTASKTFSGFQISTNEMLEYNIWFDWLFGASAGTNFWNEGLLYRLSTSGYTSFWHSTWPLLGGTNCQDSQISALSSGTRGTFCYINFA